MSVSPEMMKLMAARGGPGGPASMGGMGGAPGAAGAAIPGGAGVAGGAAMPPPSGQHPPGPGGAPMSSPQPNHGERQNAMVNVNLAMDLLEQTPPALGSESPEGQAVLQCLSGLSKKFGHSRAKTQELVPAELMQLMQSLPHTSGAPGMPQPGGGPAPQQQPQQQTPQPA